MYMKIRKVKIILISRIIENYIIKTGFLDGSVGEESACNAEDTGDMGSVPGSRRVQGGENSNPLQYSCLKNPMDRGAWQATVQRVTKSVT